MIELNLLPQDMRTIHKKRKSQLDIKLPKVAPTPLIVSVITVIILSQVVLGVFSIVQQKRLASVSSKLNNIMPKYKVAEVLKQEADALNGKITVIDSLASGSLVWAEKLYDLNNSVIDGVWLRSLSLDKELPKDGRQVLSGVKMAALSRRAPERETMVLEGSAVSSNSEAATAIVGRFIDSLKSNGDFFEDFEEIKLSSIQRQTLGETEIMNFTIICYFKPGRSYFEKL